MGRKKATDGRYEHPDLFKRWADMHARCGNKAADFKYYKGRGIKVCERWKSLANFLTDMGPDFSPELQLDRKDNSKGYSPENCRWVTRFVNMSNTRRNVYYTYKDKRLTATEWDRQCGFPVGRIKQRLKRGWSIKKAIETPKMKNQNGFGSTPEQKREMARLRSRKLYRKRKELLGLGGL